MGLKVLIEYCRAFLLFLMTENVPSPLAPCEVTVLSNGATAIVDYAHNCNSLGNILNSGDVRLICGKDHEQYRT